jgi:branched-chain amino acid transport system ATP-binding protein
MTNPDLLILDEATEGLSPLIAQEIWAIIRRLRAGGLAAIVVDKNFAAISALADRNVVLVKGRVVLAGSSADLKAQPELLHRHLGV